MHGSLEGWLVVLQSEKEEDEEEEEDDTVRWVCRGVHRATPNRPALPAYGDIAYKLPRSRAQR